MGTEIPNSGSDWDNPFNDEDFRAIDSALSAAAASAPPPTRKRRGLSCPDNGASADSLPKARRRMPDSLFVSQAQQNNNEVKFEGRIIYSRTVEEVERAAEELLAFAEAKKRKEGQCVLGLDIEWRASFRRGVAPGKAAVMQICGENSSCHVLHIIHSQIPKNLQCLLEDPTYLKVGVCISNDAAKVLRDHNVSINNLGDLSNLANQKLGGEPKKWSLSTLTEMLVCRQLPKPNKIRLGNWEAEVLSIEKLKYAATDAYVSWYLYQVLKNLPDPANDQSSDIVVESK